jgi:glucan 1,3-beta-glucosidase
MEKSLHGVNLGGWLVLEKWITPSLFNGTDAVDEHTYCQKAGKTELKRLKDFRDTWITQGDFAWLAEHGVQAVRLPLGYWAFGSEKPYVKTIQYVDKAFEWAEESGIQILLDLHGVVGSQNGKFHSGKAGEVGWPAVDSDYKQTLKVIERLAKRYGNSPALLGISLLNEPSPDIPKEFVLEFYKQAYQIIRNICGKGVWVVYSQGFRTRKWRNVLRDYENVLIDYHHYQNFRVIDRWLPARAQIWRARWQLPLKLRWLSRSHPVVIGEWSLVYNAWDKKRLSNEKAEVLAKAYAFTQQNAFRKSAAYFYWTYKTENGGAWSLSDNIRLLKNIRF